MTLDGDGMILRRREGTYTNNAFSQTTTERGRDAVFTYGAGQQVAEQLRDGSKLDVFGLAGLRDAGKVHKDQQKFITKQAKKGNVMGGYDAFNQRYSVYGQDGASRVQVQSGDTLQGIAQRVYGNSSLWYVLASANAISSDSDLIAGTQLKVPDVGVSKNDSTTFKPYNPNEIVGSTSPNLPYVPPAEGCSGFAYIIMAVVAIVVSAYAPQFGNFLMSSLKIGAVAAKAIAVGTLTFGAHAATSAVGSALGLTSFSWRASAAQGITAGLTAGLAEKLGGSTAELLRKTTETSSQATITALRSTVIKYAKVAVSAVGGGLFEYVGNKIAGVKNTSFSWKAVAAYAVTDVISSAIANTKKDKPKLVDGVETTGTFWGDVANRVTRGVIGLHVRRKFGFDDKVDYGNILASSLAGAAGTKIGGDISNSITTKAAGKYLDAHGIEYRVENGEIITTTPMIGEDGMPTYVEGANVGNTLKAWIRSGQSDSNIDAALSSETMRLGLLNYDLADSAVGIVTTGFIANTESDNAPLPADDRLLPALPLADELTIAQANRDYKVLKYAVNGIAKFGAFAEENPMLANMSVIAIQSTLTGGPIKNVVTNFAKTAGAQYFNIPNVYDLVQRKVDGYLSGNGMDPTVSMVLSHGAAFIADFGLGIGNKNPVDNAKSINKLVNEAGEKLHGHHSMPVFLKDGVRRSTDVKVHIPESMHKELHKDLNVFLAEKTTRAGGSMRAGKGNSGKVIRDATSLEYRVQVMREFYQSNQQKYPTVAADFFRQYGTKP